MPSDNELASSLIRLYGMAAYQKAKLYADVNGKDGDATSKALWLRVAALIEVMDRQAPATGRRIESP